MTTMTLPTFNDAAITATKTRLAQLEETFHMVSENGTDRDVECLGRKLEAIRRGLKSLTMPSALRARRMQGVQAQAEENRRVAVVASATAKRDDIAIVFEVNWATDGTRDTEEMLVWPNGEVQSYESYENEERLMRLARNPYL